MKIIKSSKTSLRAIRYFFLLALCYVNQSSANCTDFGKAAKGCDVCVNSGSQKVGLSTPKAFDFSIRNTSEKDLILFRDSGLKFIYTPLQKGVIVEKTNDLSVGFSDKTIFLNFENKDTTIILMGEELKVNMTGGVVLFRVPVDVNDEEPSYRGMYELTTYSYDFDTKKKGKKDTLRHCAFVFSGN